MQTLPLDQKLLKIVFFGAVWCNACFYKATAIFIEDHLFFLSAQICIGNFKKKSYTPQLLFFNDSFTFCFAGSGKTRPRIILLTPTSSVIQYCTVHPNLKMLKFQFLKAIKIFFATLKTLATLLWWHGQKLCVILAHCAVLKMKNNFIVTDMFIVQGSSPYICTYCIVHAWVLS